MKIRNKKIKKAKFKNRLTANKMLNQSVKFNFCNSSHDLSTKILLRDISALFISGQLGFSVSLCWTNRIVYLRKNLSKRPVVQTNARIWPTKLNPNQPTDQR